MSVFSEHQLQHFVRCSAISYLCEYITRFHRFCALCALSRMFAMGADLLSGGVSAHSAATNVLSFTCCLVCLHGVHHRSLAPARVSCLHVRSNACECVIPVPVHVHVCTLYDVHKLFAFRAPRSRTSALDSTYLSFALHPTPLCVCISSLLFSSLLFSTTTCESSTRYSHVLACRESVLTPTEPICSVAPLSHSRSCDECAFHSRGVRRSLSPLPAL